MQLNEDDDDDATLLNEDDDEDGDYPIEEVEGDDDSDEIDYSDRTLLLQLLMNQQLSAGIPITSRVFDCHRTRHFDASAVSLQGYRDNMEDQHLIHFQLKSKPNCSVFGVFDGHGGDLTSKFVRDHLLDLLEEIKTFDDESLIRCMKDLDMKWIEFENQRKLEKEATEEKEALAFVVTPESEDLGNDSENEETVASEKGIVQGEDIGDEDEDIDLGGEDMEGDEEESSKAPLPEKHPMNVMATNEYGCVGSTVVYCIVQYNKKNDNYRITTVNLGDSRAILLKKGSSSSFADPSSKADDAKEKEDESGGSTKGEYHLIELTQDHKPDDLEEKERIINAGGEVKFGRVDGDLALSRAIGDVRYKHNDRLPPEEQKISCVPAITHQTCSAGDILMVFCDGIVECKSNEDILQFIHHLKAKERKIKPHKGTPRKVKPIITSTLRDDKESDAEDDVLGGISIVQHLREPELQYLSSNKSLNLIPRHNVELKGLEKMLLNLTDWALDSGSKDNMTAMMIKIGGSGATKKEYERIWCPGEFYQHKKEFNNIGDEIDDKEKLTLDRFMRLFEADCKNTGWNMHDEYENALLQKILYINDLITTMQQKANIAKLIKTQNHKLMRLEQDSTTTLKSLSLKSPKSKSKSKSSRTSLSKKTPKSPTMGGPEDESPTKKGKKGKRKMVVAEDVDESERSGGNEEDDGDFSKESPRKRRKI